MVYGIFLNQGILEGLDWLSCEPYADQLPLPGDWDGSRAWQPWVRRARAPDSGFRA